MLGLVAATSVAGTVTGIVRNGTSARPAASVEVTLIQLQGGMQPVANTKTDADGHFRFDHPLLGAAPMLVRAVYRGVNFQQAVPPGSATANLEIFEPTDMQSAFSVTAHAIIFQTSGSDLVVGEEFNVENKTEPPRAFFRADGSFRFSLPSGAQLSDVSAVGPAGMPVVQTPLDKGKAEKAIVYPFRPGQSSVRMSYKLPYPSNQAQLRFVSPYGANRVAIFAPPGIQISAQGFSPAGQEQGYNVYLHDPVAANAAVAVSISGAASEPIQQGGAGGDDSSNAGADAGTAAPTATVTTLPARLDSLKWIVVAGFAALFALGLIFLWRQPVSAPVAARTEAPTSRQRGRKSEAAIRQAPASGKPPAAPNVEREVQGSLDDLKDALLRLELRRQAGTISDTEYTRERDRMQKTLREFMKG